MNLPASTFVSVTIAALAVATCTRPAAGAEGAIVDTAAYSRVLEHFVSSQGLVRYAALKAETTDLDQYLASLAAVEPQQLGALPENDRIAFWINAYNAITLKTVVDSYPIQARGLAARRYPTPSIRQIPGAWTNRDWTVAGQRMSLEDIEHETLRKKYREPRLHMALVCAALGCPPLRTEPYDGARLDDQLDDQSRRYLARPSGLQLEAEGRKVAVSAIFKWFDDDFEAVGGVRAFVARHADPAARTALLDRKAKITFLDYDWRLNEESL